MEKKYPHLCSPITIGNVTFKNRMFSSPMGGTDIENDGCIGPKSTAFYELRGRGGAGAVTVSECMVHPETDGSHAYHLDTSILNSLAAATYTADAIRRHGAIASLELSHSGMYAGTYMTDKSKQHCRELVDSLRFAAPYVAVIGDANKVDYVKTAVYQGYHAALDI